MKKSIVLFVILLLVSASPSWAQCAMCRATVGSNLSEGRGVIGTGINFGILYLLSTPYLLVAGLIYMWYRTGKKELKERLALKQRMDEIYRG
jgi:high-affinity nickel permease